MATAPPLLSIEEYLQTSYKPDVHFVDGEIEERHVGEYDHAKLQTILAFLFASNEDVWGTDAIVEQRIRVDSSRVRICDIAVLHLGAPYEPVTTTPPFICIEVMSPEDRLPRAEKVLADYFAMGVANIWLIDPATRNAYTYGASGLQGESHAFTVPATPIRLAIADIFQRLDKAIARHRL